MSGLEICLSVLILRRFINIFTLPLLPILCSPPDNFHLVLQVRSLAAESDRAYQGGPLERTYYQEAFLTREEGGLNIDAAGFDLPNQYTSRLDWFAVDLEGEHSAMDGGILEEHTEYVVHAIHRVSLLTFCQVHHIRHSMLVNIMQT